MRGGGLWRNLWLSPSGYTGAVRLGRCAIVVLLLAVVLVAAACGSSSDEPEPVVAELPAEAPPAASDPGAADEERDARDILVAFTQCLRDEGFDVPDPDFSASAAETQRRLTERGIDTDDPAFDAAVTTCEPELNGILQAFSVEELQQLADDDRVRGLHA